MAEIKSLIAIKKEYDDDAIAEAYDQLKGSQLERNIPSDDREAWMEHQRDCRDRTYWNLMVSLHNVSESEDNHLDDDVS